MGERFYIPRPCKRCQKPFIGRDRPHFPATWCSKKCRFLDNMTKESQTKAGKVAGALNIARLRGTGVKGYIKEYGRHQHRVVLEKLIGRKLTKDEVVHHKDGNKHNNDIYNLQIVTRSEHGKIHAASRGLHKKKSS